MLRYLYYLTRTIVIQRIFTIAQYTTDTTQLDSWVASAVCTGFINGPTTYPLHPVHLIQHTILTFKREPETYSVSVPARNNRVLQHRPAALWQLASVIWRRRIWLNSAQTACSHSRHALQFASPGSLLFVWVLLNCSWALPSVVFGW